MPEARGLRELKKVSSYYIEKKLCMIGLKARSKFRFAVELAQGKELFDLFASKFVKPWGKLPTPGYFLG
jgi:hypothetical protein